MTRARLSSLVYDWASLMEAWAQPSIANPACTVTEYLEVRSVLSALVRGYAETVAAPPCCASSHWPPDTACKSYRTGQNGRCVYCDHEQKCHPGPGAFCELGSGERGEPMSATKAIY